MPIYLSEYIGSGRAGDLFRPRGSEQPGWAAIDLRPDGGATLGGGGLNRCLLSLPAPDPDARLYQLATEKGENVPVLVRAGMAARLNATLNYTRLDDLIADLLLRPPARAWKPLRDRPTQQLAIYLGGLLSPSPALRALAAVIYDETWNAADSGSLTADLTWSEAIGTGWQIVSNQARMVGNAGYGMAIAQHDTDTDDQRVTASLVTFTRDAAGQVNAALAGRIADADTGTFYQIIASVSPSWSTKALEKYVSGAGTSLGSVSSASFSLPEAMRLTMDGSSIGGAIGSSTFGPVTDTAISGQTRGGIVGYTTHASNLIALDNFELRDVTAVLSATVNQATETELAQAITRQKRSLLGQPSETELAQALTTRKRATVAQSTETDLAQAITHCKVKTLGQTAEADLAQPITAKKTRTLGQTIETDSVPAVVHQKQKTLGLTLESETAQALTRRKNKLLGQPSETDLAQPVTRLNAHTVVVNQAIETDLVLAVSVHPKRRLIGSAGESEAAQAVAHLKRVTLSQASEVETASPLTARKLRTFNLASETELAQPLAVRKLRGVAFASEIDLAQALTSHKIKTLAQAPETDTARPITYAVFLVGYIRIVNLSGRLPGGRAITGRLPHAVEVAGRLSTAVDVEGVL